MCGHVGIITQSKNGFDYKATQAFKQMLYVDTLRGDDATGICIVNNEQGAEVFKEGVDASHFLLHTPVNTALTQSISTGRALLGHNRKATVGGHKDSCAHPFVYDDRYVFFHNGTLMNHKTFGDEEVDSESLGKHLVATEGNLEKVTEVIHKAYGAWCCVWYDSVKHCIYFLRNKERPFYFLHAKNGDIYYASEAWIAAGIGLRNGITFENTEVCEEDTLYTLDLTQDKLLLKKDPIPKKVFPQGKVLGKKQSDITKIGTTKHISKKQGEEHIKTLNLRNWVSFKVKDIIYAYAGDEPKASQCSDYLVFGWRSDMPGVEFRGCIENIYPYEADNLIGRDVHGALTDAKYGNGIVEAWFDEVYEVRGKVCH